MAELIALLGPLPKKMPDKQYREYLSFARQLYRDRSEDSPVVQKVFSQFVDHCPNCGAGIEQTRRIRGGPKGRYPIFIAVRRCRCGHEFRHVEGAWEWNG